MSIPLSKKSLSVTFVLPFVNVTGGIKILLEHANRLAKRGHQVTIIYPGVLFHGQNFETFNNTWQWRILGSPLRQLKYWLFVDILKKTEADWFPLDKRLKLHRVPDLSGQYLHNADIVIATAPETVPWVTRYPKEKGLKVHFAQDYESWYLPEEFLDSTLNIKNTHLITSGSWQKKLYEEKFGRTVEAFVPNGVDTIRFQPKTSQPVNLSTSQLYRVLLSYHHAPYKGIADGLAAIELAKKAGFRVQTVMFGVHPLKANMPSDIEYHKDILENDLPALYQSCDVFIWPTHREGFGLPPMEALACGIPVVGTRTGALPDYMVNGVTGYIVPIKQPEELAKKLIILLKDPVLRQKMGQAGRVQMEKWDWEKQSLKLEEYLQILHNHRS